MQKPVKRQIHSKFYNSILLCDLSIQVTITYLLTIQDRYHHYNVIHTLLMCIRNQNIIILNLTDVISLHSFLIIIPGSIEFFLSNSSPSRSRDQELSLLFPSNNNNNNNNNNNHNHPHQNKLQSKSKSRLGAKDQESLSQESESGV